MRTNGKLDTRKLTIMAMLCAIGYVSMFIVRIPLIPAVPFVNYDPKDVAIAIGGLLYGPIAALIMAFVVAFFEMITVSHTGYIGLIMNVLSSASFVCTAAFIYKKKRTLAGAVIGLVCGVLLMVIVMLLWNFILTPVFMLVPREVVVQLLVPAFLPFNLLKGGLNAAIIMLLYKPFAASLRKTGVLSGTKGAESPQSLKSNVGVIIVSLFLLVSLILVVLALQGRF